MLKLETTKATAPRTPEQRIWRALSAYTVQNTTAVKYSSNEYMLGNHQQLCRDSVVPHMIDHYRFSYC